MKKFLLLFTLINFISFGVMAQVGKLNPGTTSNAIQNGTPITSLYGKKLYMESQTMNGITVTINAADTYMQFDANGVFHFVNVGVEKIGKWTYNASKNQISIIFGNSTDWDISSVTNSKLVLASGSNNMVLVTILPAPKK